MEFLRKLIWAACLTYFFNGMAVVMLGPVLPSVVSFYHITYSQGGLLVLAQSLGFFAGVPISALSMRRFPVKHVVASAVAFATLFLILMAIKPNIWLFSGAALLTGFSVSATEAAIAAFIMEAFTGRRAVVMSYLEVAFGLGALVMPGVASLFLKFGHWNIPLLVAAALALPSAWLWLTVGDNHEDTAADDSADAANPPPVAFSRFGRMALLLGFLLMIMVYVGLEVSLSSFLPSIFIPWLHIPAYVASLSVTAMWIAMVIGRVATGFVIRRVSYGRFLTFSSIAAIVALVLISLIRQPGAAFLVVFVLGLAISGIYSVTMVFANHSIPGSPRMVTNLITMVSGCGGAVLPPVVGVVLSGGHPGSGLWVISGYAVFMTCMLFVVMGAQSSRYRRNLQEIPATLPRNS